MQELKNWIKNKNQRAKIPWLKDLDTKGILPEISHCYKVTGQRKALRPAAHHFSVSYILQHTVSQHLARTTAGSAKQRSYTVIFCKTKDFFFNDQSFF